MNLYMAEVSLPGYISHELMELIPSQRLFVDNQLRLGTITSYALAVDRSKLWVILSGENMDEVEKLILQFPIADYVRYTIFPLAFHNSAKVILPKMSLN